MPSPAGVASNGAGGAGGLLVVATASHSPSGALPPLPRRFGGDGELVTNPRGVAIIPLQQHGGPPARGASAVPSWTGDEATTALVVCEKSRLVVVSLAGALLQELSVDGATDMWSVAAYGGKVAPRTTPPSLPAPLLTRPRSVAGVCH